MEELNSEILNLELNVLKFLERHKISKKDPILVSVSGGSDSLALLFSVFKLGFNVIAFHLNHNLRKESADEEIYLKSLFDKYGIKSEFRAWDGNVKKNLEAEAREKRYKNIQEITEKHKIKYVAIGHHANDQIETFFMNLARGSSIDGLSCMLDFQKKDDFIIIRPLLNLFKNDCKDYLITIGVKWIEDESNNDISFKRNKIRNILSKIEDRDLINKRILNTVETFQDIRIILDRNFEYNFKKIVKNIDEKNIQLNLKIFKTITNYEKNQILNKIILKLSNCDDRKIRREKIENIIQKIKEEKPFKSTIKNIKLICTNIDYLLLKI